MHEILRFHSDEDSSRGLLGCDVVKCCFRIPTFQRSMLPRSPGWRSRYPTTLYGAATHNTSTWMDICVCVMMSPIKVEL